MKSKEFKRFRKRMNKTQHQMGQLLGLSVKAVHSYEQGWRNIPAHAERQMLFLISKMRENPEVPKPCWVTKKCSSKKKKECPAWEFKSGDVCWLINGTICDGTVYKDWQKKMKVCRSCEVLKSVKKL